MIEHFFLRFEIWPSHHTVGADICINNGANTKIRNLFGSAIINKLPNPESDLEKIHFVYQMVNGVLINNLLNPWHVYRPENPALQRELIQMAIAYLKEPTTAQEA